MMKKLVCITAVTAFFMASQLQAQTAITTTTSALTEDGLTLYNAHKYKEAIASFNKAIKENPKDGKAFYYRGMSKMHDSQKGFCKDLEESLSLGYSTSADIYYYGCETHDKK